jgi:hypothetical protein
MRKRPGATNPDRLDLGTFCVPAAAMLPFSAALNGEREFDLIVTYHISTINKSGDRTLV